MADLRAGRLARAEAAFATIPLHHPRGLAAIYNRVLCLVRLGRPDRAQAVARALAEASPRLPAARREAAAAALYGSALALTTRGYAAPGRQLLQLLTVRFPGTAAARRARTALRPPPRRARQAAPPLLRCVTAYRAKRYGEALICFRARLAQDGASADLLYATAYAAYQVRRYKEARRLLRRAHRLRPRDGDTLFMLGLTEARLGDYDEATGHLRTALAVGMQSERPREARRVLGQLAALRKARPRSGWLIRGTLALGYDSHPHLTGIAASSGTSDSASAQGSGYAALTAGLGYRWVHRHGATLLDYRFHQWLVFTDLYGQQSATPGRRPAATGEQTRLSFQSHRLGLEHRQSGRHWTFSAAGTGRLELVGLRPIDLQAVGGTFQVEGGGLWHRLTSTYLGLGYAPQRAVDSEVSYLTGHGLQLWVEQRLHLGSRFRVALRYRFGKWWLGTLTQTCDSSVPCAVRVPFSHQEHRAGLTLRARLARWFTVRGAAQVLHRIYDEPGEYLPVGGTTVSRRRIDTAGIYSLELEFRLRAWCRLGLSYSFTHNHSTIDEASTGIEESYHRHVAEAYLTLERW